MKKKIVVGICGASGICYSIRFLQHLLKSSVDIYCIVSKSGFDVMLYEEGLKEKDFITLLKKERDIHKKATISFFKNDDFFAPFASGTFLFDGMVILPCSMKTLASISYGIASNLIIRGADVCLKEKRKLILVPRETPLNIIHIENMLRVAKAGGVILPPFPSFYLKKETKENLIDGTVLKIFDQLNLKNGILKRWKGK